MSSDQISRDGEFLLMLHFFFIVLIVEGDLVSAMKKKLEKEAMEQEIDE